MSLVLSRKKQQRVVLFTGAGERIVLTVEAFNSQDVKLSFNAPDSVTILREELVKDTQSHQSDDLVL